MTSPSCLIHGLPYATHDCLFCCLCYRPLTPEECHVREDGVKEDVCEKCAIEERDYGRHRLLKCLRGRLNL